MPKRIITSLANSTGKPFEVVENLWSKAKETAKKEGHEDEYGYIVGILKSMLGIKKSLHEEETKG